LNCVSRIADNGGIVRVDEVFLGLIILVIEITDVSYVIVRVVTGDSLLICVYVRLCSERTSSVVILVNLTDELVVLGIRNLTLLTKLGCGVCTCLGFPLCGLVGPVTRDSSTTYLSCGRCSGSCDN